MTKPAEALADSVVVLLVLVLGEPSDQTACNKPNSSSRSGQTSTLNFKEGIRAFGLKADSQKKFLTVKSLRERERKRAREMSDST